MEPDLFIRLDREWAAWNRGCGPARAFQRWTAGTPDLCRAGSFDNLLAVFERRREAPHSARDGALLALIRLAPGDPDAYRTLLHLLRSGLMNLSSKATGWWGWDEASAIVVAAAVERISRYPMHRTARVAANILGDVWHSVWLLRQTEQRLAARGIELVDLDGIEEPLAVGEVASGQEVLALVDEAVGLGRISRPDGRLVALHRVFGFTNAEVADMEGMRPCTVGKRRLAAETAMAAMGVAS